MSMVEIVLRLVHHLDDPWKLRKINKYIDI
jgi:hypothetical protein